jgi:hypothetical protein
MLNHGWHSPNPAKVSTPDAASMSISSSKVADGLVDPRTTLGRPCVDAHALKQVGACSGTAGSWGMLPSMVAASLLEQQLM